MNAELIMGKFNSSSSSSIWYKGQHAQEEVSFCLDQVNLFNQSVFALSIMFYILEFLDVITAFSLPN